MGKNRDLVVRGRIGGFRLRATHDPKVYTAPGRAAFLRRFWPNDPNLDAEEARRRAEAGLRAHMCQLALKSARSRARRGTWKAFGVRGAEGGIPTP